MITNITSRIKNINITLMLKNRITCKVINMASNNQIITISMLAMSLRHNNLLLILQSKIDLIGKKFIGLF